MVLAKPTGRYESVHRVILKSSRWLARYYSWTVKGETQLCRTARVLLVESLGKVGSKRKVEMVGNQR